MAIQMSKTPIRMAVGKSVAMSQNPLPREGVAALPYTEFGNPTNINSVKVAKRPKHIA